MEETGPAETVAVLRIFDFVAHLLFVRALYLITFSCYGSHLHGQEGTVDRHHNTPGTPALSANNCRLKSVERRMVDPPYVLDAVCRKVVLFQIRETCEFRKWDLIAVHVRSNHVHVIVRAEQSAEHVMDALKAYASRALARSAGGPKRRKYWTRHGSTRYLWTREEIGKAIQYVVAGQGDPMEVFCAEF